MKRLLLSGVAIAAITVLMDEVALPADLAPVYKARPPVVVADLWTGFYAGVNFGGAWGTKEFNDPSDELEKVPSGFVPTNFSNGVNGILGGVQVGYNQKIGWVVFGIEGEFSGANVKGSQFGVNTKVDWVASVAGRLGATVDRALLYVKGGAAWVHDKYSTSENGIGSENINFCSFGNCSASYTKVGFLFGVGVEYAFPDKWSGKIEYNYLDFGTKSVLFCNQFHDCDDISIRQNMHVIKAGLNRRF